MNLDSKKTKFILVLIAFFLSRLFIYLNPPQYYSDVKVDYERYANIWYYGLTPYKEHLYEYPPLSVPLVEFPLILDQRGIGKYYPNYRFQILLIDIVFFLFMLTTIKDKLSWTKKRWFTASLVYIAITTTGKNFFYEGLDLAFTAAFLSSILLWAWVKDVDSWKTQIISWALFWLSTAIKFLTLPLLAPLAVIFKGDWLKRSLSAGIGFAFIWGIPLLIYGTSLSVSFVYNSARPIKYASFPAYIINFVDSFTQTETYINKAPDFESVGPISDIVTTAVKIIFPTIVAAVLIWGLWWIYKMQKKKFSLKRWIEQLFQSKHSVQVQPRIAIMLNIYAIYVFSLFLFAKTFSQPFHIWYLPLIMLYPFKNQKQFWLVSGAALLMVILDMTPFLYLNFLREVMIGPITAHMLRDLWRFIPMAALLYLFIKDTKRVAAEKIT